MLNKSAQIAETMTWVIATLIIIVILTLSIFVVSSNPFKKFREFELNKEADLLAVKSLTGYLLTEKDGKKVFDLIKSDEKIKDFEGNLASKIFKNFYEKDYSIVWFGINFEGVGVRKNDYFEDMPVSSKKGGDVSLGRYDYFIVEKINLIDDKNLELRLVGDKNDKK